MYLMCLIKIFTKKLPESFKIPKPDHQNKHFCAVVSSK